MLLDRYEHMDLTATLLPADRFAPFPKAGNREPWEALMPDTRESWIQLAEKYADYCWPSIKAEHYRGYWKNGNLSNHSNACFERRCVLGIMALAECIEGKGRFLDQVINGIFAICEETTWVGPLHRLHTKENMEECMPDPSDHMVELFTATTADLLVWIRYLMKQQLDSVSIRICNRIEREVRERMLKPYMERSDYWWMGFTEGVRVNNWNPWCNSSALMAFLLLEDDRKARAEAVHKIMRSSDVFIKTYPADGCCDEGPTYWGHSGGGLYVLLELLSEATNGKIDIFDEPLIRDIGNYIYKMHIHDNYFVAFADGDAQARIEGGVVYRYGKSIGDELLMQLGSSRPDGEHTLHIWFGMYAYLRSLFLERERVGLGRKAPYVRDCWLPATQVMMARQHEGSEKGLFLAAKGGHNLESHNHNDVGSFIVFVNGNPLFIDPGTEEYCAKTFGPDRYELWYLQSQYHNLPTIRGVLQKNGKAYQAKDTCYEQGEDMSLLSLDIADAYPAESGIVAWRREFKLVRTAEARIEVSDSYRLKECADDIFFTLMTPCEPVSCGPGTICLEYALGQWATLLFDSSSLKVNWEQIDMDNRLKKNWGERMYRIVLREKGPVLSGSRVIKIFEGRTE